MKRRKWDKAELEELYSNQYKTLRQVGSIYGVSHQAIRLNLLKFNIPIRKRTSTGKGRKPKWNSLSEYLANRITTKKEDHLWSVIPEYLKPPKVYCSDCHRHSPHMHIHHIKYPARSEDDFLILCASCHSTRHRKGITWDKQLSLYRDYLNGLSRSELKDKYNISYPLVAKLIQKLNNGYLTLRR